MNKLIEVDEQIRVIAKGADEIIDPEDLKSKLERSAQSGKPLTVKLGLDPSAPDIHLGHAVVLRKLKQIQDLGHNIVIIIGDYTGMIGDPTGKSKTRKPLSKDEVLRNAETYRNQIFKILDRSRTTVRFNSEWLEKLNFTDVINLASKYTVTRMLEREDFKNRFRAYESIGLHEFFYPLMQGYDSIALNSDIELGGTDQRFNILVGRNLQRNYGQESQVAMFMPILEGIDGVEKMSKSLGNYVGINEPASVMYEKIMKIPDNLIVKYFELTTDLHPDDVDKIRTELKDGNTNPRDVKMRLAREVTSLYHSIEAASEAEEQFITIFQKRENPDEIASLPISESLFSNGSLDLVKVLTAAGFAASNSEARRLIQQGGVKVNGVKVNGLNTLKFGSIIQAGKSKFVRIG